MSGVYVPRIRGGLGQVPTEISGDMTTEEATGYIREKWGAFQDLSRKIIDLQHRAALARQSATERGDTESAEAALALIRTLGDLNQWHNQITLRVEQLGVLTGLGSVIAVAGLGVGALALLMLWAFRKYEAQERALEAIEAGTLTLDEYLELDAAVGKAPGVGPDLGGLLKLAALGIGLYLLFRYLGGRAEDTGYLPVKPSGHHVPGRCGDLVQTRGRWGIV
jgi:hypothetical protein